MKRLFSFIIFLCITTIFTGCKDENPKYDYGNFRIDFVTVLAPDASVRFLRDDGILLQAPVNSVNNENLVTGKRVLIQYIPGEKISSDEQSITIQSIAFIPGGEIIQVPAAQIEAFGNTPFYLTTLWVGGGYLNLRYKIEWNNSFHQFAMFCAPEKQVSADTLYLDLRHKTGNEEAGYLTKGYAAFSLSPVQNIIGRIKAFKVSINTINLKQQNIIILNKETL